MGDWEIYLVDEVRAWIEEADAATHLRVVAALDALADVGPGLGRPLVDTIKGSSLVNLKELSGVDSPGGAALREVSGRPEGGTGR